MTRSMKIVIGCLVAAAVCFVAYALVKEPTMKYVLLYTLGAVGTIGAIAYGLDWGWRINNRVG